MRICVAIEDVERRAVTLLECVLERGLEAVAEVDDEFRVSNGLDISWRELEVVRLRARWSEVDDAVDRISRNLLRRPGERIERRDNSSLGARIVAAGTPGGDEDQQNEEERAHGRDRSTSLRTGIIIVMTWTADALARLREASGRSGGARRTVVEFLGAQDCCLSALELHEQARAGGARIGIASVYRALEGLDALGLVQRVDLGDGVARFEPSHADGDHHHHLVCDDCGKVEPFEDPTLESAIERVADGRGYVVAAHDVVLHGACEDCRQDDAPDDRPAAR
jgi:Fur family ferric uptake transcriptional regulator